MNITSFKKQKNGQGNTRILKAPFLSRDLNSQKVEDTWLTYFGAIFKIKKMDQDIPSIVIMPGLKDSYTTYDKFQGYDPEENRIVMYVPG